MHLLLVALDQQGYQQIKPFVDKLLEADERKEAEWHNELETDLHVATRQLRLDVEKSRSEIVRTCVHNAKRKDNLLEDLLEVTAYNDLIETIVRLKPETEDLFFQLDQILLDTQKLEKLFPRFKALLGSLDIPYVIKTHGYFGNEIPLKVYLSALDKSNHMMDFCVKNAFSMLSIITGED